MDGSDRQLVIVALPSKEDAVWKYSSEKVPHMTLLYLGDHSFDFDQLIHIEQYIEYAAAQLPCFHMDVTRRGELGPNNADVLFLNKKWAEQVVAFRNNLLQDPLISTAYNSVEQYPEWTPHLTMGYPETPAKDSTEDPTRFYDVSFDRIALWVGDYEGPEFPLKNYNEMEVAMSQIEKGRSVVESMLSPSDHLTHYGVKGMKWGVRRSDGGSGSTKPGPSEDVQKVDAHKALIKAGSTRALSNKELKEVVDRMNLEQQYSQLRSKNESTFNKGHEQVKKTLALGETASKAYNMYQSPAGQALRKLLIGV